MNSKKIIITGGSGFIGRHLSQKLTKSGWTTIVFTRRPVQNFPKIHPNIQYVQWDVNKLDKWHRHLDGAFAVINLVGENIFALRWTEKKKQRIKNSRLKSTEILVEAIGKVQQKPKKFLQVVGVGIYGDRGDEVLQETSTIDESGFLSSISLKQEQIAEQLETSGIDVLNVRTGIVLGKGGGFLKVVKIPFQLFIGGHLGGGNQWVPWIHIEDYVSGIDFLLKHKSITRAVNFCAPNPERAREFYRALAEALNRPSWFHAPSFLLKLFMGEIANEVVLPGQRVAPTKLLDAGFNFKYPDVRQAFADIFGRNE